METKKRLTVYVQPELYKVLMEAKGKDTVSHFCEKAIINGIYKEETTTASGSIVLATVLGVLASVGFLALITFTTKMIGKLL